MKQPLAGLPVVKQTIAGFPVELSKDAPSDKVVVHPELWRKIVETIERASVRDRCVFIDGHFYPEARYEN